MALPPPSGYHIKEKHPADYARILHCERERDHAKSEAAKELEDLIEDMEGNIDEHEEDLTATPSQKRPAAGEEDLFKTPKSKQARPDVNKSVRKSIFHRPVKYNIKDKRQYYFDIETMRYIITNNMPYEPVNTEGSKRWFGIFLPHYHLKNATTFSRYFCLMQ